MAAANVAPADAIVGAILTVGSRLLSLPSRRPARRGFLNWTIF
jgi:uncharacterized MnhB-related membrane protein